MSKQLPEAVAVSAELEEMINSRIIEACTTLGVKHVRTIPRSKASSFVRNGHDTPLMAYEHEILVRAVLKNGVDMLELQKEIEKEILNVMSVRNRNPNGGINVGAYADPSNPAQVAAIRSPNAFIGTDTFSLHLNTVLSLSFFISFYDDCDYYMLENGEKLYVTALLAKQDEPDPDAEDDTTLDFGSALKWLRVGARVARRSWVNISYILLVPGSPKLTVDAGRPLARAGVPVGTEFCYAEHIDAFIPVSDGIPMFGPWVPSQPDILATDWYKVDE